MENSVSAFMGSFPAQPSPREPIAGETAEGSFALMFEVALNGPSPDAPIAHSAFLQFKQNPSTEPENPSNDRLSEDGELAVSPDPMLLVGLPLPLMPLLGAIAKPEPSVADGLVKASGHLTAPPSLDAQPQGLQPLVTLLDRQVVQSSVPDASSGTAGLAGGTIDLASTPFSALADSALAPALLPVSISDLDIINASPLMPSSVPLALPAPADRLALLPTGDINIAETKLPPRSQPVLTPYSHVLPQIGPIFTQDDVTALSVAASTGPSGPTAPSLSEMVFNAAVTRSAALPTATPTLPQTAGLPSAKGLALLLASTTQTQPKVGNLQTDAPSHPSAMLTPTLADRAATTQQPNPPVAEKPLSNDVAKTLVSADLSTKNPADLTSEAIVDAGFTPPLSSTQVKPDGALQPSSPIALERLPPMIAKLAKEDANQTVGLQLDPIELGSVSFSMDAGPNGLVVTVTVDRPETLDLMRRHADQFLADLRQSGFAGASLHFGQSNQSFTQDGQRQGHAQMPSASVNPSLPPSPMAPRPKPTSGRASLDLRL